MAYGASNSRSVCRHVQYVFLRCAAKGFWFAMGTQRFAASTDEGAEPGFTRSSCGPPCVWLLKFAVRNIFFQFGNGIVRFFFRAICFHPLFSFPKFMFCKKFCAFALGVTGRGEIFFARKWQGNRTPTTRKEPGERSKRW